MPEELQLSISLSHSASMLTKAVGQFDPVIDLIASKLFDPDLHRESANFLATQIAPSLEELANLLKVTRQMTRNLERLSRAVWAMGECDKNTGSQG
jgi:hypothetical protein